MRRIIIVTLLPLTLFVAACSKSDGVESANGKQSLVSPAANITSTNTLASGSGKTTASAIDDPAAERVKVESPLPPPTGFVNDYAKVIDARTKKNLETTLRNLKENSKVEFAVVTVETTGEQSSSDYVMAVSRGWGVGSKDKNGGGLILLVAIRDRKWEIRWTRSLMTDLENGTGDELERLMTTPFRQGNYSEGIAKGVESVIARLSVRHKDSSSPAESINSHSAP
ncbi:MAG: TPM domain-containing protein [Acidobacteria bacterium]|nr:TPM domain-containing protein [Acidobacteriota bacterium]